MVFIDEKTYVSVSKEIIWWVWKRNGSRVHINIVLYLYDGIVSSVRAIQGRTS